MTETKRDTKTPLPFYELPPHIKPCSQIIEETRLQLKYSSKMGSDIDPSRSTMNLRSSPGGGDITADLRGSTSRLSNYDLDFINQGQTLGLGHGSVPGMGVKAVHTKRPFTPRDSVNLWGMSARKRPPSAITLSRLSIDETDLRPQSRSGKGALGSGKGNRTDPSPRYESLDSALGNPILLNQDSAKLLEDTEIELEKTRLRFMALSSIQGKVKKPEQEIDATKIAKSEIKEKKLENKKSEVKESNSTVEANAKEKLLHEEIPSLNVAAEWLTNFLEATIKIPKDDLIQVLIKVKDMMAVTPLNDPLKSKLTKLIFKIVEKNSTDEDILFWASFILLHCQIIGNNLTTVFKMVFKASRSQAYWSIIQKSEYLNVFMYSLGEVCPLTQTESMIYGYGTLKFICTEEPVLSQVLELNLISVMVLHLKILNYESPKMKKIPESIQNGVFQLTSILRSVVGIDTTLPSVASSGLLEELCNSLNWTIDDIDVISNIVRILSVVSSNDICCQILAENDYLCSAVVRILKAWHSKDSIVVRLTYCLGNLLAKHEGIRIRLYQEPLALEMIIQVICYYLENFTESSEDILIKSIRILANWSLCPSIGRELCEVERVSEILNSLLEAEEVSNELLLCTISTLNNLSYHKDCVKLDMSNIKTAECLYNYLNLKNLDVRTETMKVLGNLTRNEVIRGAAADHVGTMLISLQDDNSELLCATTGVLMNVILEEGAKKEFVQKNGVAYIINLMTSKGDVGLNLMLCQLLWNLVISDLHLNGEGVEVCDIMAKDQIEEINSLINARLQQVETHLAKEFVGRDGMASSPQSEDEESYQQICLEYVSVARTLVDKLNIL